MCAHTHHRNTHTNPKTHTQPHINYRTRTTHTHTHIQTHTKTEHAKHTHKHPSFSSGISKHKYITSKKPKKYEFAIGTGWLSILQPSKNSLQNLNMQKTRKKKIYTTNLEEYTMRTAHHSLLHDSSRRRIYSKVALLFPNIL